MFSHAPDELRYRAFDATGDEVLRLRVRRIGGREVIAR
jgi:hypothetical protein